MLHVHYLIFYQTDSTKKLLVDPNSPWEQDDEKIEASSDKARKNCAALCYLNKKALIELYREQGAGKQLPF